MNWINANKLLPERINEWWCPDDTAQEVLVQFIYRGRTQFTVGWHEEGQWWANDEPIKGKVICWAAIMDHLVCPSCEGKGQIVSAEENKLATCIACNGSGYSSNINNN